MSQPQQHRKCKRSKSKKCLHCPAGWLFIVIDFRAVSRLHGRLHTIRAGECVYLSRRPVSQRGIQRRRQRPRKRREFDEQGEKRISITSSSVKEQNSCSLDVMPDWWLGPDRSRPWFVPFLLPDTLLLLLLSPSLSLSSFFQFSFSSSFLFCYSDWLRLCWLKPVSSSIFDLVG